MKNSLVTGRALIVFAKSPVPGRVKTRLVPPLTEAEAARLYAAFIEDSLAHYAELPVDVRLYLAGADSSEADSRVTFRDSATLGFTLPDGVTIHGQQGANLGERMKNAFADCFDAGYEAVVITGTDHPSLPGGYIEESFAYLNGPSDIVLGPTDDGGYYLLGMKQLHPEAFSGMTYSHSLVFEQTVERLRSLTSRIEVLRRWYDVDRPSDLIRLLNDLTAGPHKAPRTLEVLTQLADRYGWSAEHRSPHSGAPL